ncbi:hypothetical protein [Roseibium album]|uniref:hypothetical protein n=1 Tax=Roseibium album TaxID=311410 RepID=UPI00249185B9|nr:hypothetical protein [Roseibium album]
MNTQFDEHTPSRPALYHRKFLPKSWSADADLFDDMLRSFSVAASHWDGSNDNDDLILACLMALYKLHWSVEAWEDCANHGEFIAENLEFIESYSWNERPRLLEWYEYFSQISFKATSEFEMDNADFFELLPSPCLDGFKAEHRANIEYHKREQQQR